MSEIYLFPEEFSIEPEFNTRVYPLDEDAQQAEDALILGLAASIASQGQLDAVMCVVDPARPLPHVLFIGHRRRRAIASLNQKYALEGKPLIKLRTRIDVVPGDPFRKAALSNMYTKSYSPIELAALIHHIRRKLVAYGPEGTRVVADFLEMVPAYMMQTERLLTQTDPDTRAALHKGIISPTCAFDLLTAIESKRKAILDLAAKIQSMSRPSALQYGRGKAFDPADNIRASNLRITRKCLLKAMDQIGPGGRPIPRSVADVRRFCTVLEDKQYGYYDSGVRTWARSFFEWMGGNVTDEEMMAKFNAMAKFSHKGHRAPIDDALDEREQRDVKRMSEGKRPRGRPRLNKKVPRELLFDHRRRAPRAMKEPITL